MDKNRMYQLYELRDEIKKALENSASVEASEKLLSKILSESEHAEAFKDFVKGLSSNWDKYEENRKELSARLAKLDEIIEGYEKKDEMSAKIAEIVSLTLEAIGAVYTENAEA